MVFGELEGRVTSMIPKLEPFPKAPLVNSFEISVPGVDIKKNE
jgi:hypothetical protein